MSRPDFKSATPVPVEAAIRGAIKALNTAPCIKVPSLGDGVTSYDAVRHLEAALSPISGLLDAVDQVAKNWERGDLAGAVRELCAAANACRGQGIVEDQPPWYTVIGHYSDSAQIFGEEVQARDGLHAFAVAASLLGDDAEFTAAVLGRPAEGQGIFYPESVVDGATVASQPEVFGTPEPTADCDGQWAIKLVEQAGYRLVEAQEPEVSGRWDWIRDPEASDTSFETREAAAMDALEAFAPFEDWKWEVQNGDTQRGYREWAESKAEQEADEIAAQRG